MAENKSSLKSGFSKGAKSYDKHALVQEEIAAELTKALPSDINSKKILDIGCGTGFLCRKLFENYPDAEITGMDISGKMLKICLEKFRGKNNFKTLKEDAEYFNDYSNYNLITSSYCFQWFHNKQEAVKNIFLKIKKETVISIAVPVKGSFLELEKSFTLLGENYSNYFELISENSWKDCFKNAGLDTIFCSIHENKVLYASPIEALKSFNRIGAGLKNNPHYKGLNFLKTKRLAEIYKNEFADTDNKIPVSYRTLIITGTKK